MAFTVVEITQDESERSDKRTDRRVFRLIADNDGESTYTAREAAGLPVYGDPHDQDNPGGNPNVRARRILARREGGSVRMFTVEVEYEQFTVEITDEDDPLLDVTKVSYRRERQEVPYNRALYVETLYERLKDDGTTFLSTSAVADVAFESPVDNTGLDRVPVTGSARDPLDPLPIRKKSSLVMVCTRNEENVDFTVANDWQEAVNTDEFSGADPGTLFLEIDVGDEETRGGVTFRPVTYIFSHRPYQSDGSGGWDDILQDKGFSELKLIDPLTPELGMKNVAIVDPDSGQPVTEPKLLNGEGQRLPQYVDDGDPIAVYRVYRPYENRRAFADLDLGI